MPLISIITIITMLSITRWHWPPISPFTDDWIIWDKQHKTHLLNISPFFSLQLIDRLQIKKKNLYQSPSNTLMPCLNPLVILTALRIFTIFELLNYIIGLFHFFFQNFPMNYFRLQTHQRSDSLTLLLHVFWKKQKKNYYFTVWLLLPIFTEFFLSFKITK
jgi:hypothetical protein